MKVLGTAANGRGDLAWCAAFFIGFPALDIAVVLAWNSYSLGWSGGPIVGFASEVLLLLLLGGTAFGLVAVAEGLLQAPAAVAVWLVLGCLVLFGGTLAQAWPIGPRVDVTLLIRFAGEAFTAVVVGPAVGALVAHLMLLRRRRRAGLS